MAALTGFVVDSKGDLLRLDNSGAGLSGSLQTVKDGTGASSALQLSTGSVNVNGTFKIGGSTLTLPGNFTLSGAYSTTLTVTNTTNVTLPTTGTLSTLSGAESLANKTLPAPILSGSVTGTYTLAGTPTITGATLTTSTLNGLTVTSSTGTLTIANGKTLTLSNILTFTGTDSSSVAFGAGGTVAYTTTSQTLTNKTLTTPIIAQINDSSNNKILTTTAAGGTPVNYIDIGNSTTGVAPTIAAKGTDTNIDLWLFSTGTGIITGRSANTTTGFQWYSGTSYQHLTRFITVDSSANRAITFPDADVTIATQAASVLSFSAGTGGNLTAGNTYYIGTSSGSTTTDKQRVYIPFACTVSGLYVFTTTAPGSGHTQAWTIYKNNSSTALTCTISDTAVTANDTTHSFTCAAGDYLELQIVMGGSATTTAYVNGVIKIVAT